MAQPGAIGRTSAARLGLGVFMISVAGVSGEAGAFTFASPATAGCHESITSEALRAVRLELASAGPLPADRNERALIADLQFTPDPDMKDLGAATLLVGARDNDLKGRGSTELSQLTLVHGDPARQREHCLRSDTEKEPGGSEAALGACRAFVREMISDALTGLDAAGRPDPARRTSLPLYLELRHRVNAPLPTYYLRMGQALHTVEDSFSHTYRTPDGMKITVILDWIDVANGHLVETRDGPPHSQELDRCDDQDDLRSRKHALATRAAADFLRATLAPDRTSAQKLAAVDALLDEYMSYSPGCTFANGWCQAAEHRYGNSSLFGCAVGGPGKHPSPLLAGALLALLAALGRRRRAPTITALALVAVAGSAHARTEPAGVPPPPVTPVAEPGPKDPSQTAVGGAVNVSGSITDASLAFSVGARVRINKHWGVGLDAEWNPWVGYNGPLVRPGVFNGYATGFARLPLAYQKFNLRSTVSAGFSRMLMDLYGAPRGTTGVYVGFSPLGLEWKMSSLFYLIVNPLNFALPAPQLRGVPFLYPEYRTSVGLEFYIGR
jgi:MYXO-CTERM domain-containing protein